jgi:hypothetical protein
MNRVILASGNQNGLTKANQLTLQFSGKANTLQIDTLLDLFEKMLVNEGIGSGTRRRLYSIAMEALQNLNSHVPDQIITADLDNEINAAFIKFLFEGANASFRIETTNYVLKENLDHFLMKLDYINTLDEQAKKEYYNYLIKNLPFSEKGGAGLGLVDIARKSKHPIRYTVSDSGQYYAIVTLSIALDDSLVSNLK